MESINMKALNTSNDLMPASMCITLAVSNFIDEEISGTFSTSWVLIAAHTGLSTATFYNMALISLTIYMYIDTYDGVGGGGNKVLITC